MELLELYLGAPWVALGVAILFLCSFVYADATSLPGRPKAAWLMTLGGMSSMALLLAEVAFLVSISPSGLSTLWVIFTLFPLTLLAGTALWLASIPAVRSKDLESSLSWWKSGVGITFVIWSLGSVYSGFGFAIDAGVILLISGAMTRRACKASFASKPPPVSEVTHTGSSLV